MLRHPLFFQKWKMYLIKLPKLSGIKMNRINLRVYYSGIMYLSWQRPEEYESCSMDRVQMNILVAMANSVILAMLLWLEK